MGKETEAGQGGQTDAGAPAGEHALFSIGVPGGGVDAAAVVDEIRATVERKRAAGVYDDARVARAELSNVRALRDSGQLLDCYLRGLREAVCVDISDFTIHERRRGFAPLLVTFKKLLWNLLKFYTYRLWSQQNDVNGLLLTAIESVEDKYAGKVAALEERLRVLESAHRADPPTAQEDS